MSQDSAPAAETLLPFPLFRRGKVRDVYDLGDDMLIVASDRISAFDVVLPTLVPGKGELLTAISNFWFERTGPIIPNHRSPRSLADHGIHTDLATAIDRRSVVARKAERIDIECVVRSRLAGSGWREYHAAGTLAAEPLPAGLKLGDPLPEPRFTPALKNDRGHDENISRMALASVIGRELASDLERTSLALFAFAEEIATRAGFVLADTKFEFGFIDGDLTLIDEALTPDSSRYWDRAALRPGEEPPSFDKQVVRDWLEASGWNKEPPGPDLPADLVASTVERYGAVLHRLRSVEKSEAVVTDEREDGPRWIVEAEIMPKQGVNDPQGEAVMSGLRSLGFAETQRVRCGKLIRVEISADDEPAAIARGTEMCDRLLANPVIEEYVVSVARIG